MNSLFSRDGHLKSMELTVSHAEKYLGLFCSLLASYTRKTAKLRDKADLLVQQLHDFSNTEDPELRTTLKNLAEDLAMVQDYRQAQVERLETRVVAPLKTYGEIVKTKRAELKRFNGDRNRELKELQKLDRVRQKNPADRQSIAESNAQKATNNAQRSTRLLEEAICHFQRQKLEDIKRIFGDFITVEMLFHAKALEVYTHTFQNLESMDVDKDMELYTGRIRVADTMSIPMDTLLTSRSSSSMARQASPTLGTSTLGTGPSLRPSPIHRRGPGTSLSFRPTPVPAQRTRSGVLLRQRGVEGQEDEEEEDDDEEEEEEEEAEMYESDIEEAQPSMRQSYAAHYAQARRQQK